MNDLEIVTLLKTANSGQDWSDKVDMIKASHGGNYPESWFKLVLQSGLMDRITSAWGGSSEIKLSLYRESIT